VRTPRAVRRDGRLRGAREAERPTVASLVKVLRTEQHFILVYPESVPHVEVQIFLNLEVSSIRMIIVEIVRQRSDRQ
jgi:hypothetical protein